MTPPRGRKPTDDAPRSAKVIVRMTERDKALLDALKGAKSANQFILDALRDKMRSEVK